MNGDAAVAAAPGSPESPDPGLYGPASEAWRLNREAMLLLGAGPRALLLQIAHPAVAAGVADHSDFRTDPWRRLAGTLRSYLTIVYGTTAAARGEIRRLNALHRGITGPGYAARDPELSLWVHATLIDSTIAVADAWLEPVGRDRRAAFYAETRPIGRAFGVPDGVAARERRGVRRVRRGDARAVGAGPRVGGRARAGGGRAATAAGARSRRCWVASRPGRTPGRCGPRSDCSRTPSDGSTGCRGAPRERLVSAWLVAGWRAWRPLLPGSFRQMPKALAADRRMAPPA